MSVRARLGLFCMLLMLPVNVEVSSATASLRGSAVFERDGRLQVWAIDGLKTGQRVRLHREVNL